MHNRITKKDLDDLLNIEFDYGAKTAFLKMTTEEKMLVLLGSGAYNRAEIATLKKQILDIEEDTKIYRRQRETKEKENGTHPVIDTDDLSRKIAAGVQTALAGRFDLGVWFRDKVLPTIISSAILVFIALWGLYMVGFFKP